MMNELEFLPGIDNIFLLKFKFSFDIKNSS